MICVTLLILCLILCRFLIFNIWNLYMNEKRQGCFWSRCTSLARNKLRLFNKAKVKTIFYFWSPSTNLPHTHTHTEMPGIHAIHIRRSCLYCSCQRASSLHHIHTRRDKSLSQARKVSRRHQHARRSPAPAS